MICAAVAQKTTRSSQTGQLCNGAETKSGPCFFEVYKTTDKTPPVVTATNQTPHLYFTGDLPGLPSYKNAEHRRSTQCS